MTNTTNAPATKKTSKIGASVTCPECNLTYGDHAFGCTQDEIGQKFIALDRKFLQG